MQATNPAVAGLQGVVRRLGLATCCILAPILISVVAFHLVIDNLVPANTHDLSLKYRFASDTPLAPEVPGEPEASTTASQPAAVDHAGAAAADGDDAGDEEEEAEEELPADEAVPDPDMFAKARLISGMYESATGSAFLYLVSAATFLFASFVIVHRLSFLGLWKWLAYFGFLLGFSVVAAQVTDRPGPFDHARPLIVDKLLDKAGDTLALKPLVDSGPTAGARVAGLVNNNTFISLVPVGLILGALFALSIRPKSDAAADVTDLLERLRLLRWALALGSAILVLGVLSTQSILHWPLDLLVPEQKAALEPIASALTLQVGASGTIALIAAFAPAILAWSLDVSAYRKVTAATAEAAAADPGRKGAKQDADEDDQGAGDGADDGGAANEADDDDLVFAPTATMTALLALLAPLLAAPVATAIKSLVDLIP